MAGPLNGIGGQQQVPITNSFQQGQNNSVVRENEEQAPRENVVQPKRSAPAEALNVATNDQDSSVDLRNQVRAEELSGNERRGSLIDIVV